MKIAVLLRTRELSGTQKRSAKIASALNQRGHQATLFYDKKTYKTLTKLNYEIDWPPIVVWSYPKWLSLLDIGGTKFERLREILGLERIKIWGRKRYWSRLFNEHEIDVAHIYIKWRLCQEMPIPHIFEITSPTIARKILEFGNPFPPQTVLHPNSEGVADVLADLEANNEIVVAPHAYFDPTDVSGSEPTAKENLVVFGHRLIPRKNPIVFAKAAKRFLAEKPDWKVAIRGLGPEQEEVESILAEEINDGRALIGFDPNLMKELQRSRVFVSIESEDNYSNQSVLEAMWCYNALLMSDRGRTRARYYAQNGKLCDPDENSVFEALLEITHDPEKLCEMAMNGRNHVEANFNREKYLEHIEITLASAIKNSQGQRDDE